MHPPLAPPSSECIARPAEQQTSPATGQVGIGDSGRPGRPNGVAAPWLKSRSDRSGPGYFRDGQSSQVGCPQGDSGRARTPKTPLARRIAGGYAVS